MRHNHMANEQIFICPMHPEIQQDKPGRCPECGMNLVPSPQPSPARGEEGNAGHDKHAGHSLGMFVWKFWVSLALTVPIVLYSELPMRLLGARLPEFVGLNWFILFLGSIIFFYGGWVFLAGAHREIRGRLPGMMTLIGIAIVAAYSFSVLETLRGSSHTLFWELSTLITVMLAGHYLEMRAVQGVQGALKELAKLLPDEAEIIITPHHVSPTRGEETEINFPPPGGEGLREGGKTKIIHLSELKVGDLVLVRPGGRVPADGEVIDGSSDVNESLVTGESRPVPKKSGDKVIAGTINGDGSLQIRITEIGENTFLAGVMRLVAEAQASKSKLQILSDRAAFYLTIIALSAGAITFISWLVAGESLMVATERLVAVLVVACPHALGLAVPLVASISTTMAARKGFLVKHRLALEAARNIDIVLFDKTGTLTKGEFGITQIIADKNADQRRINQRDILQYAASVNQHSEHPLARAMVQEAKTQNIELFEAQNFQRIPGQGATATINGEAVVVGSEAILKELPPPAIGFASGEWRAGPTPSLTKEGETPSLLQREGSLPATLSLARRAGGEFLQGRTVIYVTKNNQLLGSIALADQIRAESREAIRTLKGMGIKTAMITGDSEDVAAWVAGELNMDEYFARVMPEEKSNKVKVLQDRHLQVAMVGDGINDAPALTAADLGIAIGAGTNVAMESAGIILMRNDPRDIVKIIRLSKLTYRKMIQNLFWATGYNVVALPLAAGVLAFRGIVLQPALAALFMSLSTVIVAFNALLLRKQVL